MRVLVAGGSGYIGGRLVPYLEDLGHLISVYDLKWGANVTSEDHFSKACAGQEAVIYLASLSNNDACERNPNLAKRFNEDSFPKAYRASERAGVKKFIYASSVAAYGSSDSELIETDPLNPTTLYGEGKKFCEDWLFDNAPNFLITRCASVCGYSPNMRYDLMVNKMVRDARLNGSITINGGEQVRSHVHINDVCEFYDILLHSSLNRTAFNLVHRNMTVRETADLVAGLIGRTFIIERPRTDDRSYAVSGRKTRDMLGFAPSWTIENAIVSVYI